MELQFNKTVVPCLRTVLRDTQVQEQTQEVRLSDGMPDIGKVLASWGQVVIRGKEWHSAGISVSGGVMAWVLYAPEDGSEPRCVENWLPFQMKWEFQDVHNDGTICVQPMLYSVDARSVSARKLMVRSVVSVLAEAMVSDDVQIYTPGELPEDICILKNSYPMQIPVEAGEKVFTLEDYTSLPESQPTVEKLIRYQLQPEITEQKILVDKVVFRGNMILHILYRGTDSRLHSWDFEIPFSQFGELSKEYGPDCVANTCFAVTNLEVEQGEGDTLRFKVGLTGQYKVYDRTLIEVVEDAYSPVRQVKSRGDELRLPAMLDSLEQQISAEGTVEADASYIADVSFNPERPRIRSDEEGMTAQLNGNFQVLYYDDNDFVQCASSPWEGEWSVRASKEARVEATALPFGASRAAVNGMNIRLHSNIKMDAMTWAEDGLSVVTGLEMGELEEPDPNRPSLVLCRAGEESLWSLAKRNGSTVDAIKKANNLDTEPDSKQLLLIPVS